MNTSNRTDAVIATIFVIIGFLLMVMAGCPFAHGAIAKHHNSLGVVQYEDNPYTYVEGAMLAAFVLDDKAVNVRIQPRATYNLFTQDILLCDVDDFASKMEGVTENPIVLTYETVAHRSIQGIGCHEVIAIDEVKSKDKP